MKRWFVLVLCWAATSLSAADLVLEDFEGKVELRSGAGWKALDIGGKAPETATVRVSGDGLAEFRAGSLRVHITKDGTYQLSALVDRARSAPAPSLFDVVAAKTDRLLGKFDSKSQVNAGVRADRVAPADLTWAEESDVVPDPVEERLNRAQELSKKGRNASALRVALETEVAPTSRWYAAASLLVAQEALTVGDYDLVLSRSAEARPVVDPETGQSLLFLEALARAGLGQTDQSTAALQAVVAAAPGTEVGQKAAALLRR